MNHRKSMIVPLLLAATVVIGCVVYVAMDTFRVHAHISETNQRIRRTELALAKARDEAREVLRGELRKRDDAVKRSEGENASRNRKELAKLRRAAAKRMFFGSVSGLKLPQWYLDSCKMPESEPTEEDKEIIELAGELACEEDLDTAAEVTAAALKSPDPRARMAAVEMLSALGEVGLADIGEFLTDEHPEVANLAAERWELGVQDIINDAERTALVKVGLLSISDGDQLRSMVGTLLLSTDERMVINTVTDVMRDGNADQREAVKAAYENVTGEQWTDEQAAEKWLRENYTPAEKADEEDSSADESADEESDEEVDDD